MVTVRQLSVFLENKSGRLIEVLEALGKEHIRITALTIADTSEYGILRLIVSDPENGYRLLKASGASVIMSNVLAMEAPAGAGASAGILQILSQEGISIEYMYAFSAGSRSILFFRTGDQEESLSVIGQRGLRLLGEEDIRNL